MADNVEHRSEIRTEWKWNGPRTMLTCVCGDLEVEVPQGASVDFPIAKYAAHAFEVAMARHLGPVTGKPPPSIGS